jgi:transcriptional regulator with XRE-family HTH domain
MKTKVKAISMNIGSLIREMRKAAGMSQMRLAEQIGVSYQQVQKYEKGASKLSVPRLMQISDVFGVPVTTFLDESKRSRIAEISTSYSSLNDSEVKLLMLFRRLKRKKLKVSFLEMLKDLVRMSEGK